MYEEIDILDCPVCGGPGVVEEENGWCCYIMCLDCGSHTAEVAFSSPEEKLFSARQAARLWNMSKVIAAGVGE